MLGGKPELLGPHERGSATWAKLKAYLEERLAKLREKNDRRRSQQETDFLRGEIAEVKHLLSLGTEKPVPAPDQDIKD